MKYLIAMAVFLTGCATAHVSEYNRGCQDGIRDFAGAALNIVIDQKDLENVCDQVDTHHNKSRERK